MDKDKEHLLIDIYLKEYDKLKDDAIQRVGFRDNLIYVNLIAIVSVISIVANDLSKIPVLLVLPVVSITLGWTYLVNR